MGLSPLLADASGVGWTRWTRSARFAGCGDLQQCHQRMREGAAVAEGTAGAVAHGGLTNSAEPWWRFCRPFFRGGLLSYAKKNDVPFDMFQRNSKSNGDNAGRLYSVKHSSVLWLLPDSK